MRSIRFLLFFISFFPFLAFGQSNALTFKAKYFKSSYLSDKELKTVLNKHDFSKIWTQTDNQWVYGFIGNNFQRIRVKLISVTKSSSSIGQYNVFGKSMVKRNICVFNGVLTITGIRKYNKLTYGADDEFKHKGIVGEYAITGVYLFNERKTQDHAGTFKGVFGSDFYLTRDGKIHYDDTQMISDGYTNNDFAGSWTSYDKKITEICNWGDYRIPDSGDLDAGAGEFSPADKYLSYGWQTIRDTYSTGASSAKAKKEEKRIWWK